MRREFAEWYSQVWVDPPQDVLHARWTAIEAVRRGLNREDVLSLVRAGCRQKPPAPEAWTYLQEEFAKPAPGVFGGREAEFSTLAAITLAVHLKEAPADPLTALIAYCLTSATFNGWQPAIEDLQGTVAEYLTEQAIAVRARRPSDAPGAWRAVDEEVNVLWWLFGEWDPQVQSDFRSAAAHGFPLLAASQLAAMTELVPGPVAHRRFLARALQIAQSTTAVTLGAAIERTPAAWREAVVRSFVQEATDFQPILTRIAASVGLGAGPGNGQASNGHRGPEDHPMTALDIAEQLYAELLIGRIYRHPTGGR